MPATQNELLKQKFVDNIILLSQQMGSHLMGGVSVDTTDAKQNRHNTMDRVEAVERTQRHGVTPHTPQTLASRWTIQEMWEMSDWIDRFDAARSVAKLTGLTGKFTQNFAAALGRAQDGVILRACGSAVTTGETGGSTSSFDANFQIAVSSHVLDPNAGTGDVALTTYKLFNARRLIAAQGGSLTGEFEVFLPAIQLEALAADTRFASWLYNSNRPVEKSLGNIGRWSNFNFHVYADSLLSTTNTTVDGSGDHLVYVLAKEAIQCDVLAGEQFYSRIEEDKDHSFDTLVYASTALGAGRLQDRKIVQIAADPTPIL